MFNRPGYHRDRSARPQACHRHRVSIFREGCSVGAPIPLIPTILEPVEEIVQRFFICDSVIRVVHLRWQIAAALVVSENTVESHCAHVYEKLGVHNRRELLALFRRSG